MKKSTVSKLRTTLALVIALGAMAPLVSQADDLFQLFWRGTSYTTNAATGALVIRPFSEATFIRQVAQDNNVSPASLVFVYRPNKRDTAVVSAATGAFVADVIQMEFSFTDVSNQPGTFIARQAFLFDEAHQNAIGSAAGIERPLRNQNGTLLTDSFRGTFQYAIPETNAVYIGSFFTGRRIRDTSGGQ
ncbi:MAG TPA: hypothetical protein VNT26_01385 [Candidatus Sulfotelmatobacter sp.]|nr:hypothetical protein [Candidatus Sulfotelmatobacter sp.]HWI58695.1 hypothetical protein [Bacillota bacterium]